MISQNVVHSFDYKQLAKLLQTTSTGYWNLSLITNEVNINFLCFENFNWKEQSFRLQLDDFQQHVKTLNSFIKNINTTNTFKTEQKINVAGNDFWIEFNGQCLRRKSGDICEMSGTFTNTTEKSMQLIQLKDQLIQQQKLNHELQNCYEKSEQINKNKGLFLANVSHEIRTPLTAILGFAEVLKEDNLDMQKRQQFINIIHRNGHNLIKIIDDILDLSKIEADCFKLESTEFALTDLIQDVFSLFQEQAKLKNISLDFSMSKNFPHRLISDSARIRQILINLISNALKFTDHGRVILTADYKLLSECKIAPKIKVEIKVKDDGIGIGAEQKQKLFIPFAQMKAANTKKIPGSGLGLALSKKLATALGGDITIEDTPLDTGCTFNVSFQAFCNTDTHQKAALNLL